MTRPYTGAFPRLFTLRLADGREVTGPIDGVGDYVDPDPHERIRIAIANANAGRPTGIPEPSPGHISMPRASGQGADVVDIRGALLVQPSRDESLDFEDGIFEPFCACGHRWSRCSRSHPRCGGVK